MKCRKCHEPLELKDGRWVCIFCANEDPDVASRTCPECGGTLEFNFGLWGCLDCDYQED